jgi:hypothetical protein
MEAHPRPLEAYAGVEKAHSGSVAYHSETAEAHPGAVKSHSEALEAHSGAMKTSPVHCKPGSHKNGIRKSSRKTYNHFMGI